MAVNYGLIGDFASGIKEGLIGLQTKRAQDRQEQQFNLLHNAETGEDGNLQLNEAGKTQQGLLAQKSAADAQTAQLSAKRAQDEADPESDYNKASRDAMTNSGYNVPDSFTAPQIKEVGGLLGIGRKSDTSEENKALDTETKRLGIAEKKQGMTQKIDDAQEKIYSEMSEKAEGKRGAPTHVSQAMVAQDAIRKAMDIVHQYPSLNDMPDDAVKTFRAEIAKVATGGVPGEHTMGDLNTPTMESEWNKLMSKTGNKPNGAQLGSFLQNNVNYLNNLSKTNDDIVNTYKKEVFKANQNRLSTDRRQRYQDEHPELFSKGGASPDVARGLLGASAPQRSKDDQDAIDWAQAALKGNPNDPQAIKILKANGM